MGLSSSENRMIVGGIVLAWYRTVTDGQTVRRSDLLCWRAVKNVFSYCL